MTEPTFHLRFFFDAGSGICLWSSNDAARERFGYAVDPAQLPISENLRRVAVHVCAWYDTSLDWGNPGGSSPWSAEEAGRFAQAATSLLAEFRTALGSEFVLADECRGTGRSGLANQALQPPPQSRRG